MIDKIKNYLVGFYDILFAAMIVVLPFSKVLPNIVMAVLIFIFVLDFQKKHISNYAKSHFLLLLVLVLYLSFQALANGTFGVDISFYKKHAYLILLPILTMRVIDAQKIKVAFIICVNVAIIVSLFMIVKFRYKFGYFPMGDSWATNYVLVQERPYAGIMSIIAIILSFEQIVKKSKRQLFFIASLMLSIAFIFFIAIRISALTIFLLTFVYILFYLKTPVVRKLMLFGGLIAAALLLFISNKNISKRFFIQESVEKTVATTKELEPRFIIYSCVGEIMETPGFSFLFGTDSYSNIEKGLKECYEVSVEDYSRKQFFVDSGFNTHSQFIDFYLIGGLIAILMFIIFLATGFYYSYTNFYSIAILLAFILILAIENIFHRQLGCFIFSIFTALYFNREKSQ